MKAKAFFFLVAKLALFRDSWQGEILSAKINVSEPCPNHDFSSWESPGSSGSYGVVSLMVKSGESLADGYESCDRLCAVLDLMLCSLVGP